MHDRPIQSCQGAWAFRMISSANWWTIDASLVWWGPVRNACARICQKLWASPIRNGLVGLDVRSHCTDGYNPSTHLVRVHLYMCWGHAVYLNFKLVIEVTGRRPRVRVRVRVRWPGFHNWQPRSSSNKPETLCEHLTPCLTVRYKGYRRTNPCTRGLDATVGSVYLQGRTQTQRHVSTVEFVTLAL
jgi:hypothetical protein